MLSQQELKKHNVKEVVRVCEPTYKVEELKAEGINVIDLVFDDGTFPPNEVNIIVVLMSFQRKLCDKNSLEFLNSFSRLSTNGSNY